MLELFIIYVTEKEAIPPAKPSSAKRISVQPPIQDSNLPPLPPEIPKVIDHGQKSKKFEGATNEPLPKPPVKEPVGERLLSADDSYSHMTFAEHILISHDFWRQHFNLYGFSFRM